MTTLNDFLFPVQIIENPENTNTEHAYKVVGIVDGKEKVLNYCSDRYELVDNSEIFPKIEAELNERNMKFSVAYYAINDARFYAKYILEDSNLAIGSGKDQVKPMISVNHSYNGLTKYAIMFGYFRMVCSNGLVIPLEGQEETNLSIVGKHTKEIKNSVSKMFTKMNDFFALQGKIQRKFNVLTDKAVPNYADRIEEVINATKLKPSKSQLAEINAVAIDEANTLNGGVVNDWLIYNAINAYIYKGTDAKGNKSKAAPEVKAKTDKKVLNYIMAN
jgi:hypothetical protein